MAQTYLQLINKVLVALREDEVLGVTEPYAKLIGQFVNEAKEDIEDAAPWRALRTEVSFAATANTATTTLTGTNDRSYLMNTPTGESMLFRTDAGDESSVEVLPIERLRQLRLSSDASERNEPCYVAFTSDGTNQVAHFWPTPDATYNYKGIFVIPQAELTAKTDTLTIPYRPVVLRAIWYAMDERGSEFAGRLETALAKAERSLAEAILVDLGQEHFTATEA